MVSGYPKSTGIPRVNRLSTGPLGHGASHIDVLYQFVQEIINERRILIKKIETFEILADLLTKVVTAIKFNHCLDLINIVKV